MSAKVSVHFEKVPNAAEMEPWENRPVHFDGFFVSYSKSGHGDIFFENSADHYVECKINKVYSEDDFGNEYCRKLVCFVDEGYCEFKAELLALLESKGFVLDDFNTYRGGLLGPDYAFWSDMGDRTRHDNPDGSIKFTYKNNHKY